MAPKSNITDRALNTSAYLPALGVSDCNSRDVSTNTTNEPTVPNSTWTEGIFYTSRLKSNCAVHLI